MKRPDEIQDVVMLLRQLQHLYPHIFTVNTYNHPVLGQRTSLYLVKENLHFDVDLLQNINCNLELLTISFTISFKTYSYNISTGEVI